MTGKRILKLDIAREYLDASIEFFLERKNLFCSIHLSAAAEELFGAHLPEDQRISTLAWKAEKGFMSESGAIPKDSAARKSVNEWKNEIKHMNFGESFVSIDDPLFSARHHIEQALVNFYKLRLDKSSAIWRFEDHQNCQTGSTE